MKEYIIKSNEESFGDEWFKMLVPIEVNKKELNKAVKIAQKYVNGSLDYCSDANDYNEESMIKEYDIHYREMLEYRDNNSGQETFEYYLEKYYGVKFETLEADFTYEW